MADNAPHSAHYAQAELEPIDVAFMFDMHAPFCYINALKYITRAPFKGTELKDLEKAKQYVIWLNKNGDFFRQVCHSPEVNSLEKLEPVDVVEKLRKFDANNLLDMIYKNTLELLLYLYYYPEPTNDHMDIDITLLIAQIDYLIKLVKETKGTTNAE